jgi:ubiquinone/menaquinone biosynthesis C-methylase UbiE
MRRIHRAHAGGQGLFDHHSDLYDRVASRLARPLYERVAADVAAAGLAEAARVLDVGTGAGHVPILIARARPGRRVDGLDLSAGMIEVARRKAAVAGLEGRVDFIVGDVADMPYPDATFDLVVSTMSQHHWPDAGAGLRELRRVLRPSGQVWIYDFRHALPQAEAAARDAFPGQVVRREALRTGALRLRLTGRVMVGPS